MFASKVSLLLLFYIHYSRYCFIEANISFLLIKAHYMYFFLIEEEKQNLVGLFTNFKVKSIEKKAFYK